MGVEHFCTKLAKGTPLRQIWLNKSFGVCGSSVVLTLGDGEKKSTRESPLESRCRLQHYGHYRAVVIFYKLKFVKQCKRSIATDMRQPVAESTLSKQLYKRAVTFFKHSHTSHIASIYFLTVTIAVACKVLITSTYLYL